MSNTTGFLVLLAVTCVAVGADPTFTNVTQEAGITHVHGSNLNGRAWMTGGAAARDYDGDGFVDLVFTRIDDPPILYRNQGDGTFVDVTAQAGLDVMATGSNGVAWGDIDNDGDPDLYITSAKQEQHHCLFVNQGDGTFIEQALIRNGAIDDGVDYRYGTSPSFGDYDLDGWLDLHTNEWGSTDVMPPEVRTHARLLRNAGCTQPGVFTDVTVSAGVLLDDQFAEGSVFPLGEGVWSFSSRFTDLDRDGFPDLVIASDFNTSRVYWNNGDGTFTDGTASANFGSDENGMGLAVADYDADGLFDVFITSIYHTDPPGEGHNESTNYGTTGNRLYRNNGDRTFTDATDEAGVRNGAWGWGATFFDYDNDADLDLVMTNGFGKPDLDFYTDPSKLWRNDGTGTYSEVSTGEGIIDQDSGKGLLTFDYDNDGDLDVVIVNNEDGPVLYRNDSSNANKWLRVKLVGTVSNRDAVGAIIKVSPGSGLRPMYHEIDGGNNYLSQNDIVAHFGLGLLGEPIRSIEIRWPDGTTHRLHNVPTNQMLEIIQHRIDPTGDGAIDAEDLYVIHENPVDINNDGMLDAADRCRLKHDVRLHETDSMLAPRR